ncbi:hypothetical protein K8354_09735 [Polaribacter litorisediminis]|uniref:capsular polysaccharide export protein, LipB/KpsS family n=1 Tax=Polaribacter litorisediminis TaxID=1908341 RepID=UPI001CBEA50C|nr:hypothetical protein [Polaribacter litorisediminis]UAM96623.1 hypothetical protein K8354_09735 [Polaribacter litorisediminis]
MEINKRQTILLECDSSDINKLKNWLNFINANRNIKFIILVQPQRLTLFKNELMAYEKLTCISYNDIFNFENNHESVSASEFYDFNRFYVQDEITFRLLDRDGYLPKYGLGIQHGISYYSQKAMNTLHFLKENNVSFLCFKTTPHHSVEWLLAKAADFLNIDVFTTEKHIFPWLFSISKGYLRFRELQFKNEILEPLHEVEFHINKFIEINSKDYEFAIPKYEKDRLGKGIFKYYNPFKNLKDTIKRPHSFYTLTQNFFYHKKITKDSYTFKGKYIIFFLHFQPERTTLPDGYGFTDQLFAIRTLRLLLPENINLLVKEHPSMFTNKSEPKARNRFYYKSINNIKGVSMVNISVDSFKLIDNSIAIATITGNVALESYIRKKPAILFGRVNFSIDGVHSFTDINSLTIFLKNLLEGKIKINLNNNHLLKFCSKGVVSGLIEGHKNVKNYHSFGEYEENAQYKLLTKLIQTKIVEI